jgi:hypothetical protein
MDVAALLLKYRLRFGVSLWPDELAPLGGHGVSLIPLLRVREEERQPC